MKLMLLSLVFIFSFSLSGICQPPWPSTPPLGMETEGTIPEPIDVEYELSGTVRFKTINNTDCDIDFQTWFIVEKVTQNGIEQVYTLDVLNYNLGPHSEGVITNYQLFDISKLPDPGDGNYYRIISTGVYIRFPGMGGFKTLFPNENGAAIYLLGLNAPCNCFIPYFSFNANKITLTIEPCLN